MAKQCHGRINMDAEFTGDAFIPLTLKIKSYT